MILDLPLFMLGSFYSLLIFFFAMGVLREQRRQRRKNTWQPTVSVIVPARNEAASIETTLKSLVRQDYPAEQYEVIVVDDRSNDDTAKVVESFIARTGVQNVRLLRHDHNGPRPTYKKTAISYGIKFSRGEIILTTDADCRVQPGWIASMVAHYRPEVGLVAGLTSFDPASEKTWFHKLQTLEFAGLVFCGVGAIGNRYPLICNGSNLSYRRAAYDEVGGFAGHEHIPSGDDDLFMQNVHHYTNWQVRYNLDPRSINYTRPVDTIRQFFRQRARWASKGSHYPGVGVLAILLSIYLFYLGFFLLPLFYALNLISGLVALSVLGMKILPEALVVFLALSILKRRDLWRYFLPAELLQTPYILTAGFAGFFQLFNWKSSS